MKTCNLRALVRLFCIRKLASQLYECVDGPADRFDLDRVTATNFIDGHGEIIDYAIRYYATRMATDLVDKIACRLHDDRVEITIGYDYVTFERLLGRFIWDVAFQTVKRTLPREYGPIRFQ